MRFLLHLLWRHLRQHPGRSAIGIVVLTAASTFMLALCGTAGLLHFRVQARLAQLFPEEILRLEAAKASLGPLAIESRPITGETIQGLGARAEVEAVWPVEAIRFPRHGAGQDLRARDCFGCSHLRGTAASGCRRSAAGDPLGRAGRFERSLSTCRVALLSRSL